MDNERLTDTEDIRDFAEAADTTPPVGEAAEDKPRRRSRPRKNTQSAPTEPLRESVTEPSASEPPANEKPRRKRAPRAKKPEAEIAAEAAPTPVEEIEADAVVEITAEAEIEPVPEAEAEPVPEAEAEPVPEPIEENESKTIEEVTVAVESEAMPTEEAEVVVEAEVEAVEEAETVEEAEVEPVEEAEPVVESETAPTEEAEAVVESEAMPTEEAEVEAVEDELEIIPSAKRPEKPKRRSEKYDPDNPRRVDIIFDFIELFVFTLVAVLFVTTFFVRHSIVEGWSMKDTLSEGDTLIISDLFYTPEAGDIVVVEDYTTELKKPIVKRVIATEGQKVNVRAEGVYVDGKLLNEPYVFVDHEGYRYTTYAIGALRENPTYRQFVDGYEFVVPKGELFVMGDHRNDSKDSRDIGTVSVDAVLGRVLFRLFPFDSFGAVE